MDGLQLRDEAVQDRVRQAEEFLDPSDQSARSYRADIILMLNRGFRRLTVSLDEVRTHNRQLALGLLQAPFDFSRAFDQALKNTIVALPNRPAREASDDVVSRFIYNSSNRADCKCQMYYCAYVGSFGEFSCNPRTLSSNHLNHMVSLEGIVTKCSLVRPKVVKSVHYNEKKNIFRFREYRDQTMSMNGAASTSVYPQEDEDGEPVRFW